MKDPDSIRDACPPISELSAYHDEESTSEAVRNHLKVCSSCREDLRLFDRCDDTVRLMSTPRDGLVQDVQARCRQLASEPPPPLSFPVQVPLYKLVAALAVLLTVAALFYFGRSPENEEVAARNSDRINNSLSFNDQLFGSRPDSERSILNVAPVGKSPGLSPAVRLAHTNAADLQRQLNRSLPRRVVGVGMPTVALPRTIKHVWVVDDLDECARMFSDILPADARWLYATRDRKSVV